MAEPTKLPVNTDKATAPSVQGWRPFESLRREIDRVFEDFHSGIWRTPSLFDQLPSLPRTRSFAVAPAVDVAEHDNAYEVSAELPGHDEKNVDYYVRERSFGSFERSFQIPDGVDTDKIEAVFRQGVLKVTLPKKPEVQKAAKTIDIKAA